MANIVIFDSDFIISNYRKLDNIKEKLDIYDIYIPDICINEVSIFRTNENMNNISDFKKKVYNYSAIGITFSKSDDEIREYISSSVKVYLKKFFDNNVIPYNEYSLSFIVDRAYGKIPPFSKSDEGFKDTLILLNIIDFFKDNKYDSCYFLTKDKVFIENDKTIEEEVKSQTGLYFKIVDCNKSLDDIFNVLNVGSGKIIGEFSEQVEKDIDISDMRNDLKNICLHLFQHVEYDRYNDEEYYIDNFKINHMITKDEIKEFLDNLDSNLKKDLFSTEVYFSNYFENPFLFSTKETKIQIEYLEKINDIYMKLKDCEVYVDSLINLLFSKFQFIYTSNDEEFPF